MKQIIILFSLVFSAVVWGFDANVQLSKNAFEIGEKITIDASESRNQNGNTQFLQLRCKPTLDDQWSEFSYVLKYELVQEQKGKFFAKCEIRDSRLAQSKIITLPYRTFGVRLRKFQIVSDRSSAQVGEVITFKLIPIGFQYLDFEQTQVRWDFEGDKQFDTKFSTEKIVSHIYSTSRSVSPRAQILFPDGKKQIIRGILPRYTETQRKKISLSDRQRISVLPELLPKPIIKVSPGTKGFLEQTIFRFDGSQTYLNPHNYLQWSFDGEDFVRGEIKFAKKFSSPGIHILRSRICFSVARPICGKATEIEIEIEENPTDFEVQIFVTNLSSLQSGIETERPFFVTAGDTLKFNASVRENFSNRGQFRYRWEFWQDGHKNYSTNFSLLPVAEYSFDRVGNAEAKLIVLSSDGVRTEKIKKIIVNYNQPPKIDLQWKEKEIYVGDEIFFTISATDSATSSAMIKVRIDADQDQIWDSPFRNVLHFQRKFKTAGRHVITIEAMDTGQKVSRISREINVLPAPAPQAKAQVSHRVLRVGQNLMLSGLRSVGRGLRFYWSFDSGDESYSQYHNFTNALRGGQISYIYRSAGDKNITLRVVDATGQSDTISFPVSVY